MKIKIFSLSIFYVFLIACGGLATTPEAPRREDEHEGEPEPPKIEVSEWTNWKDFLKNCKPEHNTPDNFADMLAGVIPGIQEYYVPGLIRACFKKKAQDAHDQICDARDHWERIRKNPKSPAQRSRAESELYKLEKMEANLNDKLYRLGKRARDRSDKIRGLHAHSKWKKFWNLAAEDEVNAWEDILDVQSYSNCTVWTDEDED